jgi:Domain of unknown function (DUF4394)/PEP-CTERM motif
MSANLTPRFVKKFLVVCTVGLFTLASVSAKAELLVGISFPSQGGGDNDIVGFNSSNPGTILFDHPIIGLSASESIRGIDFWNGSVYALGSAGNLYTLNYNTGQATLVGSLGVVLNGASYGVENDGSGFHIVSELGQNLTASRTTGTATVGPAVNPAGTFLSALAFRSSGSGTMFGIDSSANTLGTFNPATGTYSTIGVLGFDVARNNGFDISGSGVAYLASGATSSDVQANLYTVNLATGMASLVGLIGQVGDNTLLRGLTAVPEPGTGALLVGGLALLAMNFRRRK